MTIGEKIRSKRLAVNMSRKQLADLAGCQAQSIKDWEMGVRKPKYENLLRIAEVLDIGYMEFAKEVEI